MSAETLMPNGEGLGESDNKEIVGGLEYDYSNSPLGPDQGRYNEYTRRIAGNGEPLTQEERADYQQLNQRYEEYVKKGLKRTQDIYDQNARGNLN